MIILSPIISGAPLTPEQVAPPPPAPMPAPVSDPAACTRDEIAARVTACRPCEHSGPASATCASCDLRCTHPAALPGEQILARRASTCPADRWPLLS